MNKTMNTLLTIIILAIAVYSIWFIWTKDIDYIGWIKSKAPNVPVKTPVPVIEYGISPLASKYTIGQEIDGTKWRYNYSKHALSIVNNSNQDLKNVIISMHLPAGIVGKKIESSVNVFNVNFSSFNQPITIGTNKIENTLSNSLDVSIEKLNKHSTITIGLVLDYRNKPKEWWNNTKGYWNLDISFEYESKKGELSRERMIHPIKIDSENPFVIYVDKGINYVNMENIMGTQDTYPFSPLISKPNGSFVQIKDFDGNFEKIRLNHGEGLINSMGVDYTINTDKNYKQ